MEEFNNKFYVFRGINGYTPKTLKDILNFKVVALREVSCIKFATIGMVPRVKSALGRF